MALRLRVPGKTLLVHLKILLVMMRYRFSPFFFVTLLLLTLIAGSVSAVFPYSVEVDQVSRVTYVVDGDTFDVGSGSRIRLADIDAPEQCEEGYAASRKFLSSLILGKTVYLDVDNLTGADPYGRLICLAYIRENSTHFLNVNKALLSGGYAAEYNFTNNDFDPANWELYSVTEEAYILDFQALFQTNQVKVIYPSSAEPKPLGCGKALETDWLASAFVTATLEDYCEGLDTDETFVNQSSGKASGEYGCGLVSFGGPLVNPFVRYCELDGTPALDRAPVKFVDEGGEASFRHANGTNIPGASLPWSDVNNDMDMFLIEVFRDKDGRYIMLCYGFGWKGTYAAGKYFNTHIAPNLGNYPYSWIIVKWEDTNGDGFVNNESDGDAYTVIGKGS